MKQITKKALGILLAFVMVMTLLPTVAFAAELAVTVGQKEVDNVAGTTITIPVSLANNPGITSARIKVSFDKSALVLIKAEAKDTLALNYTKPDDKKIANANSTGSVVLVWQGAEASDGNGEIAVLTFEVAEGATAGEKALTATVGEDDFTDADMNSLPVTVVSGSVTLKDKPVAVTGVTLNKSTMSLVATAEETLTATVAPENATNKAVTWSTSNDKVAAVVNGKVTAVAPGEAVITATTADGGFTATCKVTVTEKPCAHPADKLTKVEAKEATCTEPGNAECWLCGECGKYLSADKSTVQDTIFGYAPALGHEYGNLVAAVAPTCTVNGNVAYYQCSRCEKYFNADKNPITSIVAPATGHVIQHHAAVAATCVAEGSKEYWSCASCKKNFSDAEGKTLAENVTLPVNASAHTIVNVPAKAHTCTENGIIAHYKCTGCGKLFSDKAGENEITNIVDPAAHKLTPVAEKPSTCRVNGTGAYNKCEVCGKMFDKDGKEITAPATLPLAAHTWDDVWHANSTGHYHECTVCGIAGDVTAHTPGAEATETTPQTCTVCGYIIKPATSHKEHTKGNLMSDATSHWYACTGCSEQLEKANHTVTSWTVDKAATTTEEGLRHGNCSVCQHVVYEKLAKINNTPVNPSKPGRPSGTKTVQSGKTFDAGVGVYVGLSILSLTGSAVVIGKKRKTR